MVTALRVAIRGAQLSHFALLPVVPRACMGVGRTQCKSWEQFNPYQAEQAPFEGSSGTEQHSSSPAWCPGHDGPSSVLVASVSSCCQQHPSKCCLSCCSDNALPLGKGCSFMVGSDHGSSMSALPSCERVHPGSAASLSHPSTVTGMDLFPHLSPSGKDPGGLEQPAPGHLWDLNFDIRTEAL